MKGKKTLKNYVKAITGSLAPLFLCFFIVNLFNFSIGSQPAAAYSCVVRVVGTAQKICQLVGKTDKQKVLFPGEVPVQSPSTETWSQYGIFGIDGGIPFEHTVSGEDRLYYLFGDLTEQDEGCPGAPAARDAIAYSTDFTPEDGIDLTFLTDSDGSLHHFVIPGVKGGGMEGPFEGVSINNNMYVYHCTDWYEYQNIFQKKFGDYGRSVLAKSTDNGRSFTYLYDLSNMIDDKFTTFIQVEKVENSN